MSRSRLHRSRTLAEARNANFADADASRCDDLFFSAALILLQKSIFSLNDSHAFNRPDKPHKQHWQRDAAKRWNFYKKASTTSLDLLRLHIALRFVLCPSVFLQVTQLSAIKTDN
jgi:hypothetical protein